MTGNYIKTLCSIGLGLAFSFAANDTAQAQFGFPGTSDTPALSEEMKAHQAVMSTPTGYKHPTLASNSKEKVGVALVLLIDVSGSIDSADYQAQVESMAEALESDDFRDAIMLHGSPGSIALCVADFGTQVRLRVPWVDIRKGDDQKLKTLAKAVRNLPRRESGSTNQADVIDFSRIAIQNCPWESDRRVVDLITDGQHNTGGDAVTTLKESRDRLEKEAGATLNALIIMDNTFGADQEGWSKKNLRTQEDIEDAKGNIIKEGFVLIVATDQSPDQPGALIRYFKEMTRAFKTKLRMETSYVDPETIQRQLDQLDSGGLPDVAPFLKPKNLSLV